MENSHDTFVHVYRPITNSEEAENARRLFRKHFMELLIEHPQKWIACDARGPIIASIKHTALQTQKHCEENHLEAGQYLIGYIGDND